MIEFNLNNANVDAQNGAGKSYLDEGWHTVKIASMSPPETTTAGETRTAINFIDVDSGDKARILLTLRVMDDTGEWKVRKTENILANICRVTNTPFNDALNLAGKTVRINFRVLTSEKKSIDPVTMQESVRVYNNNDIALGKYADNIRPFERQEEVKDSAGFNFKFNN